MTLIAFLGLIIPAWFFGRILLKLRIFPTLSNGENITFSLCLGLGSVALSVFGLGVVHQLNQKAIILLLVLLLIIGLIFGRVLIHNFISVLRSRSLKPDNLFILCAMVLFFSLAALTLSARFLPITDWDSQAAYLEVPRLYIEAGGMHEIPEIVHSYGTMNFELINAVFMAIGSDIAPQLLQWFMAVVTGCVLVFLGSIICNKEVGWAAATLYFAQPVVLRWMTAAKGDLGLAFFSLCGILAIWRALFQSREKESFKWVILAGICFGLAAGSKTTDIAVTGVVSVLLLGYGIVNHHYKKSVIFILLLFSISTLIVSPWYVRNVLWTGDPVYPYLSDLIKGKALHYNPYENGLVGLLLLPWTLTFTKHPYGVTAAPYFMAFLPGLLIFRKLPKWIVAGLIYIFLFTIGFYFLYILIRFLLPALTILSLIAGWVLYQYWLLSKRHYLAIFPCLATIFFILLPIYYQARYSVPNAFAYMSGNLSKTEYLQEEIQPYQMFEYIDKNLPQNAKIIAPYECRAYYCPRRLYSITVSTRRTFWSKEDEQNPDKVIRSLLENDITHVLVNQWYLNEIKRQYKQGFITTVNVPVLASQKVLSKLTLVHNVNDVYLYKIRDDQAEEMN